MESTERTHFQLPAALLRQPGGWGKGQAKLNGTKCSKRSISSFISKSHFFEILESDNKKKILLYQSKQFRLKTSVLLSAINQS